MSLLDLEIELQPKQSLLERAVETHRNIFFGGQRGGGKSEGTRRVQLIRRIKYPGTSGGIFRKTYPDIEANHIAPLFRAFPALKEFYHEGKKVLKLPNDSTLIFGYAEGMKDLPKHQGREYNDLSIDEKGDWTEPECDFLSASNRSAVPNYPAREYSSGNPGGAGHKHLKRKFITRDFREGEDPKDYLFIPSSLYDNQALLDADPDYEKVLQRIKDPVLRAAWLEGSWDLQAGQFFSDFRRDVHVVPDFKIPDHWKRFFAYDFGYNHPAAIVCFAVDEDGNLYLYREWSKAHTSLGDQGGVIKAWPDFKKMPPGIAGLDCWQRKFAPVIDSRAPDQGPTIAEHFQKQGIHLVQANVARVLGANQVREYLNFSKDEKGQRVGPRLFFFQSCQLSIDCISRMIHNPNDVEDVLKVDAVDGDPWTGDDLYDTIRYGLMSRPQLTKPVKSQPKDAWRDARRNTSGSWRTA